MAFLRNPVVYVPDLANGRPIVDGKVYALVAGTVPPMHDSAIDPADLLTVTYKNEAGNIVEQPQPLYTSKGGCLFGNYPDAAVQYMITPQEYVYAVYNRIGQLEYSGQTSASDYVETDALAADDSTVLVGGVAAGKIAKQLRLSYYVSNPNDETSVGNGFAALVEDLQDGDTIYIDGKFKCPVQEKTLTISGKKNISIIGGELYRWTGCAEHILWLQECESVLVSGVSFTGEAGAVIFDFGKQGVYLRDCQDVKITNCSFKDIGDGAIRSARFSDAPVTTLSKGISITDNKFSNCGQVTTSTSGVSGFIFANNKISGMHSVKLSRRVEADTDGWSLIYGNDMQGMVMGLELQGANNVKFYGNTVSGESLCRMYVNENVYATKFIANKNIFIEDNIFESSDGLDCVYINNKNYSISELTDVDGVISISGNKFIQNGACARGSIFLVSYSGAKLCNTLTLSNNSFIGDGHFSLVESPIANPVNMSDMGIEIDGNSGAFSSFMINLNVSISDTLENKSLSITRNAIESYGILSTPMPWVTATSRVIKNITVASNEFLCKGVAFHLRLNADDKMPNAENIVVDSNIFRVDTTSGGDILRMALPPSARVGDFTYSITNNKFFLNGTFAEPTSKPRAIFFPNQTAFASGYPTNLISYGNEWSGSAARNPRSDNSLVPFTVRNIIKKNSQSYQSRQELVYRRINTAINGVAGTTRTISVYSDLSVEIDGYWINDAANSFNVINGITLSNSNYAISCLPVNAAVLASRIAAQATTTFAVRFSTLAGVDTSPYFYFNVKGSITEAEYENYLTGA
jgi:hypothetical protein